MPHHSFKELKKNIEVKKRLKEAIQTRHNTVRSQLENNINGQVETKLIGSIQRSTQIHPHGASEIDIDILVILGSFSRWTDDGVLPKDALSLVESTLENTRYADMDLQSDEPTVGFRYADLLKVEFVPAYRDNIGHCSQGITHEGVGEGYWVARSTGWTLADYDRDAECLTLVNGNHGGRIVPTIIQQNFLMNYHEIIPEFFDELS